MTLPKVSGDFVLAPVVPRPKLVTDVPGAVDYTNQSRATLYNAMRSGMLPAYKSGARTILFYDDLDRYMHGLPRARFKPPKDETEAEAESASSVVAAAHEQLETLKDRD
jgi:hypothetical protein